jgi:serine/threonine-protein kinase RIO1
MEAMFSSETSVDFGRATRSYIPEDSTLQNHRGQNLKSYIENHCSRLVSQIQMVYQYDYSIPTPKIPTKNVIAVL